MTPFVHHSPRLPGERRVDSATGGAARIGGGGMSATRNPRSGRGGTTRIGSRRSTASATAMVTALVVSAFAVTPARADRPRIYAITGARVVVAPGKVIENGTVVMRDGLIEAVGADVKAPSDAVVVDG